MPSIDRKYKLMPPDGGYGYIICISLVIMVTCCISHITCFGMLYNDFFVDTGTTVGMITVIMAVASTVVSVTGIIANVAVKRYNLRRVAIAGAFIYTSGWALNVFVKASYQMIFTIGVLQGGGLGLLMTTIFSCFNDYFTKKRVMMMSICQVAIGIGSMIYPLLLEKLLDKYGFRGTVLIQTAIVTNTFFGAICLHPVKWHAVKVFIYEVIAQDESIITPEANVKSKEIQHTVHEKDVENCAYGNVEKTGRFLVRNINSNTLLEASVDNSYKDMKYNKKTDPAINNGLWKRIVKLLDLHLLTDYVLLNIMVGVSIGMFTDMCFVLMLPLFLYSIGLSTSNVANCISVMAGADLISRGFLAILSKFYTMKSRSLFFYVLIATSLARIAFVECKQYWTFMLMASVIGVLRGLLNVPANLVYNEYIPENFIAAYGLSSFFMGNIISILNPLMGLLRDYTNSYVVVFYALSLISLLCIIPWTIEFLCYKSKSKDYK